MIAGTWFGDANVTALSYGLREGPPIVTRPFVSLTGVPAWIDLERAVVDGFFRFSPAHARVAGDHAFDGVVGDASTSTIQARLHEIDGQLEGLGSAGGLAKDEHVDRRALTAQLEAARFELTEQRTPFREPLYYAGSGSELDVSAYLKRDYAPLEERLASLRKHLSGYAGYLESARANLEPVLPGATLEIAIEATQGQADYLQTEVLAVARDDAETAVAIDGALVHLRGFVQFLKVRRRAARDNYALGATAFQRFLHLRELVDLDIATLDRMVAEDIARNTARAEEVAEKIARDRGLSAAVASLEDDHPTAESIIQDVREMLEGIRTFVVERDLMSIPSEVRCLVAPTPSYAAYISAALDSVGPLERVASESYYYVTLPGPDWGPQRSDEWLRSLNYPVLVNTSIHEAYPGHYVQSLHERGATSLSRRLFWVQSTGEGYAHYCEQMMLEAGYSDDPRHELAQLMDALLRDCRAFVALGLHCHGMAMDDAVQAFTRIARQGKLPATREAMRGAWDPLYLNYTLGKLLIYELRREHERDPTYSMKTFHDAFLRCGNLPIPLIRELLA